MDKTKQTLPQSTAEVSTWNRLVGPYGEALAVAALAGAVISPLLITPKMISMPLSALSLAVVVLSFRAAVAHVQRSQEEQERLGTETKYRITRARVTTLENAGVPADVTGALKTLHEHSEMSEQELLKRLVYDLDLGWERTNEFKTLILKYTKFDARPAPPPPLPASSTATAPAATTTAQTSGNANTAVYAG